MTTHDQRTEMTGYDESQTTGAPPASQHTRGLEANDSKHRIS